MAERILLLRPDKAGDAIKSLPALRTAIRSLPEKEWHILCSKHNASVLEFEPGIEVHTLPSNWESREKQDVVRELQADTLPKQIDLAISLLCDSFPSVDRLLEAIPATKKYSVTPSRLFPETLVQLNLPGATPAKRDETLNIASLLEQALGLEILPTLAEQSAAPLLAEEDLSEALNKMGPKAGRWMGFCPFAGTTQRTHPLKNWKKFIASATEESKFDKFFLFGSPQDFSLLQELRNASAQREKTDVCFPSSFRALGAYLKRVDCVVTVDSGPLHFAQSLGIPVLGILSGGDAERWCPPKTAQDRFLHRGLLNRYPAAWEMRRAFRSWLPAL